MTIPPPPVSGKALPSSAKDGITPLERLYTYSPPTPIITKGEGPFHCRHLQTPPHQLHFDCQTEHRRERKTMGRATRISEGFADQCRNRNITSLTIKLDTSIVSSLDDRLRTLLSPVPFRHLHPSVSPFKEFEEDWEHVLDSDDLRSLAFEQEAPVCKCVFETNHRSYPNCRTFYPLELFLACRGNWTAEGMARVEKLNPTFIGHLAQQADFGCLHYKRVNEQNTKPVEGTLTKTRMAFLVLDDIFSVEGMRDLMRWLGSSEGQWVRLGVDGREKRLVLPHSKVSARNKKVSPAAIRLLNDALHQLLDHPSRARRVVILNLVGMVILQLDTNNQVSVSSIIPADSGAENVRYFHDDPVVADETCYPTPSATPTGEPTQTASSNQVDPTRRGEDCYPTPSATPIGGTTQTASSNQADPTRKGADYCPTPSATPTGGMTQTASLNHVDTTPKGGKKLVPTCLSAFLALSLFPLRSYTQRRKHAREGTDTGEAKIAKAKILPTHGAALTDGIYPSLEEGEEEDIDMEPKSALDGCKQPTGADHQANCPCVDVRFGFGTSLAESFRDGAKTKMRLSSGSAVEARLEASSGSQNGSPDGTNYPSSTCAVAGLPVSGGVMSDSMATTEESEEEEKNNLGGTIWLQQSRVHFDWQDTALLVRSGQKRCPVLASTIPYRLVLAYNPNLTRCKQIVLDRAEVIGNGRLGDVIGGKLYDPRWVVQVPASKAEPTTANLPPTPISPAAASPSEDQKPARPEVVLAPMPVALKLSSPYMKESYIKHSYPSHERVDHLNLEAQLYERMADIQGQAVARYHGLVQGRFLVDGHWQEIWAIVLDRLWELDKDLEETKELRLGDKNQGALLYSSLQGVGVVHDAMYRRHFMYDRAPLRYDTLPGFPAARFPQGITDDSRCRVRLIDFEKSIHTDVMYSLTSEKA